MKNPFLKIKQWAAARLNKKLQKKAIKEKNISAGHNLIKEFELIHEKKSTLSRSQRDFVVSTVQELIDKGHIKVSN